MTLLPNHIFQLVHHTTPSAITYPLHPSQPTQNPTNAFPNKLPEKKSTLALPTQIRLHHNPHPLQSLPIKSRNPIAYYNQSRSAPRSRRSSQGTGVLGPPSGVQLEIELLVLLDTSVEGHRMKKHQRNHEERLFFSLPPPFLPKKTPPLN